MSSVKTSKTSATKLNDFEPSKKFEFRLSKEQIENMKTVFDLFDTKFDGTIDVSNLGTAMRILGLLPSLADIARLSEQMDHQQTGRVGLSAFFVFMAREFRDLGTAEEQEKKMDEAFTQTFKTSNNEKTVSAVAFRSLLTNSGEALTDEEVDEVIRQVANDAEVNLQEAKEKIMSMPKERDKKSQQLVTRERVPFSGSGVYSSEEFTDNK